MKEKRIPERVVPAKTEDVLRILDDQFVRMDGVFRKMDSGIESEEG